MVPGKNAKAHGSAIEAKPERAPNAALFTHVASRGDAGLLPEAGGQLALLSFLVPGRGPALCQRLTAHRKDSRLETNSTRAGERGLAEANKKSLKLCTKMLPKLPFVL